MKNIDIKIESMTFDSWIDVARIYEEGIETRNATFEQQVPDWNSWDKSHLKDCRLIASVDNKVVGWAALSDVSGRCVYSGVAGVSVYVDSGYRGNGIGDRLLDALIKESELCGIWTLQAGKRLLVTRRERAHESAKKHCNYRLVYTSRATI